jgi:peptide/nickel transport system ATP-binding protein
MLKLDGVSKVYKVGTFGGKELRAVRNVSFEIRDREVVSLIGESGSGKTTIGKMILRLLSVGSGTISLDGLDISTLRGEALKNYYRKVQGVFQDPFCSYNPIFKADRMFQVLRDEFYPDMDRREWEAKVDASLRCVGLNPEHVLHKFPHQLSGGQLQRFLISRACLLGIDLMVADEIISMLDASTRIDVLNVLADLKAGGLSVLFITHDLSLAYYISERAIILQRGRVVEMGSAERVFHNPLHPYTKMLMASVPRLDKRWEVVEREVGSGTKPSELAMGPADEDSDGHRSELVEAERDHYVAPAG